jgi:hypothetical protein
MFIFFRLFEALTAPRARTLGGGNDRPCALPATVQVQFRAGDFLEYSRYLAPEM